MANININTPKLAFYHANCKGTGSAVLFELRPAHGLTEGALFAKFAPQKTVGGVQLGGQRNLPTFDWDNTIVTKFTFTECAQILQVLDGFVESIFEGKGFYHKISTGSILVKFSRRLEPIAGFAFEIYKDISASGGEKERMSMYFIFNTAEALGFAYALKGAMTQIAFGTGYEATSIAIAQDELAIAEAMKNERMAPKEFTEEAKLEMEAVSGNEKA